MDRRKVELQVRLVLTMYQAEALRMDALSLDTFRARAGELLDRSAEAANGDPRLRQLVDDARREVLG